MMSLTPGQMRELQRRVDDLHDDTRFLLVSKMTPRFALYYNVIDDVYVANNPKGATLFKRRRAAAAVKALLGTSVRIVRCQSKRINGVRVPILALMERRSSWLIGRVRSTRTATGRVPCGRGGRP